MPMTGLTYDQPIELFVYIASHQVRMSRMLYRGSNEHGLWMHDPAWDADFFYPYGSIQRLKVVD